MASLRDECGVRRPPLEPEYRRAQRVRLVLEFDEGGERQHCADEGWARLDGPWVHFYGDEDGQWQSWPASSVLCIDWRRDES